MPNFFHSITLLSRGLARRCRFVQTLYFLVCFYVRLELTGFIKEVRHNKHGSLTGLSLEDIVASVSELVEQKKKVWNLISLLAY